RISTEISLLTALVNDVEYFRWALPAAARNQAYLHGGIDLFHLALTGRQVEPNEPEPAFSVAEVDRRNDCIGKNDIGERAACDTKQVTCNLWMRAVLRDNRQYPGVGTRT